MTLLSVEDLHVTFARRGRQPTRAVDGVSFDVEPGETVGLVGESGCGKSVTSLAIMGLLPRRGVEVSGHVRFDGNDLLTYTQNELREIRGRDIAMVFQDPQTSLNPVLTIGRQVTEVLERHRDLHGKAADHEAASLLERVGIPEPVRRLKDYPHQLSGGMRQRAMIAMALACRPRLLIADEPTTALDVTIQAQILELLKELVVDSGTALVMITHDLGVVAGPVRQRARHVLRPDRRVGRPARPVRAHRGTPTRPACSPRSRGSTRRATCRCARSPGRRATRCRGCRAAPSRRAARAGSTPARRGRPSCCPTRSPGTRCAATTPGLLAASRSPSPSGSCAHEPARGARPQGPLPDPQGDPARSAGRCRPGGRRRRPRRGEGHDLRAGRRVGLRQVDPRPRHPAAGRADGRHGDVRRRRRRRASSANRCAGCARGCRWSSRTRSRASTRRQDVESILVEPLRAHGVADRPRGEQAGARAARGRRVCRPQRLAATRTSSAAASGSGSASRGRSRCSRS